MDNSTSEMTRKQALVEISKHLGNHDAEFIKLAKQVPDGPQRIRGVAGSGKTVFLCMKAAHMHLIHPDWNIALVFFTRTLYDTIMEYVDFWLRRFSNDKINYNSARFKLKIMHAWGAEAETPPQPGLYSTICRNLNIKPFSVNDMQGKLSPTDKLGSACCQLIEHIESHFENKLTPQFDAILIDEAQDLMCDDEQLYGPPDNKMQPIFYLAYKVLRPASEKRPYLRRLIWAYDEFQNLNNPKAPSSKEMFGQSFSTIMRGRSLIMRTCYRTPKPILMTAHSLSLGLYSELGLAQTIPNRSDWDSLGYKVDGELGSVEEIIVTRPDQYSPNPLPSLWRGPLIEFAVYESHGDQINSIANMIKINIENEEMNPDSILIQVLGDKIFYDGVKGFVLHSLNGLGIPAYISTSDRPNMESDEIKRNKFKCINAVTISRVPRAKGNEASMVYVIGLEKVVDSVQDRNTLFIALTRSRAWLHISGLQFPADPSIYNEVIQSIENSCVISFVNFNANSQRVVFDSDASDTDQVNYI